VALSQLIQQVDLVWHGVRLHQPDWGPGSHSIAFTSFTPERIYFHAILNAYWEPLDFELPTLARGARDPWRRWIDTFLDSPHDIVDWEQAPSVGTQTYHAGPRSVVILLAGLEAERHPTEDRPAPL
jgi:glycogen operon protein